MAPALFCRNVTNIEELKIRTAKEIGVLCEYKIIDEVKIGESEYIAFSNNFKRGYEFLYPFIEISRVIEDKWNCVLVKSTTNPEILVMANGYQYPRFVALFSEQDK